MECFVWLCIFTSAACFLSALVFNNNWLLIPVCITFTVAAYFIFIKFPAERFKQQENSTDIASKRLVAEVEQYLRYYNEEGSGPHRG